MIYLFRHGQASFGAENYDKLSDTGKEQSIRLGKYLMENNIKFDKVYAGTLQHHIELMNMLQQNSKTYLL